MAAKWWSLTQTVGAAFEKFLVNSFDESVQRCGLGVGSSSIPNWFVKNHHSLGSVLFH